MKRSVAVAIGVLALVIVTASSVSIYNLNVVNQRRPNLSQLENYSAPSNPFNPQVNPISDNITLATLKTVSMDWCNESINDAAFEDSLQYLITNHALKIPENYFISSGSYSIPSWIKIDACRWSHGLISDSIYAAEIQYMVTSGIIKMGTSPSYPSNFGNDTGSTTFGGNITKLGKNGSNTKGSYNTVSSYNSNSTSYSTNTNTSNFNANTTNYDIVPPLIIVPSNMTIHSMGNGSIVKYKVLALDDVSGIVKETCNPPSGSMFPLGKTTIVCSASDATGNNSTRTFFVLIQKP